MTRGPVLTLLASVAVATACSQPPPAARPSHLVERARTSMGSEVRLTAWTADEPTALEAFDQAFAEFDRLDALLSIWKDGSDVLRMNAAAGGAPVHVSPDTLAVLRTARQVSDWTRGKFDVTFGALAEVWKFDHDQDNRVPTPAEIAARVPRVDYTAVHVDESGGTVQIARVGVRVHLGGIGKGYGLDCAAAILRARGVRDFMVQSGGDLYLAGLHDGRPWHAGIRDPRGTPDKVFATLDVVNGTFSTSGDYERFFFKDGRRYHHILDPDLGQPARGVRSVTIVARSAVLADALSTGVFVSGPDAGMALIERLPDVEGVIVTAENQVLVSSGLKDKLTLVAQPTDTP
jgi:thiamine biosynthesis lipoprotein